MSSRYLYIILLALVALSKEFLVFNEEVLVLLAFAIFIYLLVNYGGEMIASELDARKEKIKEEFDLYKNLQDSYYNLFPQSKYIWNEDQGFFQNHSSFIPYSFYGFSAYINNTNQVGLLCHLIKNNVRDNEISKYSFYY